MVSTRSSQPSAMTPSDVYKIVVEAMREHVRVNEDKAYTIAIAAYPNSCDAHWHHKTIQEEFLTHKIPLITLLKHPWPKAGEPCPYKQQKFNCKSVCPQCNCQHSCIYCWLVDNPGTGLRFPNFAAQRSVHADGLQHANIAFFGDRVNVDRAPADDSTSMMPSNLHDQEFFQALLPPKPLPGSITLTGIAEYDRNWEHRRLFLNLHRTHEAGPVHIHAQRRILPPRVEQSEAAEESDGGNHTQDHRASRAHTGAKTLPPHSRQSAPSSYRTRSPEYKEASCVRCDELDTGNMIECSKGIHHRDGETDSRWYHFHCVGITQETVPPDDEPWWCSQCTREGVVGDESEKGDDDSDDSDNNKDDKDKNSDDDNDNGGNDGDEGGHSTHDQLEDGNPNDNDAAEDDPKTSDSNNDDPNDDDFDENNGNNNNKKGKKKHQSLARHGRAPEKRIPDTNRNQAPAQTTTRRDTMDSQAVTADPTIAPVDKVKRNVAAWTSFEQALVKQLMEEVIAEGVHHRREHRWVVISDRLRIRHHFDRTWMSIKNYWNRQGRQASGIDERKVKNPARMVTGVQDPEDRKRARQRKRDGSDEDEDDSDEFDVPANRRRISKKPTPSQDPSREQKLQPAPLKKRRRDDDNDERNAQPSMMMMSSDFGFSKMRSREDKLQPAPLKKRRRDDDNGERNPQPTMPMISSDFGFSKMRSREDKLQPAPLKKRRREDDNNGEHNPQSTKPLMSSDFGFSKMRSREDKFQPAPLKKRRREDDNNGERNQQPTMPMMSSDFGFSKMRSPEDKLQPAPLKKRRREDDNNGEYNPQSTKPLMSRESNFSKMRSRKEKLQPAPLSQRSNYGSDNDFASQAPTRQKSKISQVEGGREHSQQLGSNCKRDRHDDEGNDFESQPPKGLKSKAASRYFETAGLPPRSAHKRMRDDDEYSNTQSQKRSRHITSESLQNRDDEFAVPPRPERLGPEQYNRNVGGRYTDPNTPVGCHGSRFPEWYDSYLGGGDDIPKTPEEYQERIRAEYIRAEQIRAEHIRAEGYCGYAVGGYGNTNSQEGYGELRYDGYAVGGYGNTNSQEGYGELRNNGYAVGGYGNTNSQQGYRGTTPARPGSSARPDFNDPASTPHLDYIQDSMDAGMPATMSKGPGPGYRGP